MKVHNVFEENKCQLLCLALHVCIIRMETCVFFGHPGQHPVNDNNDSGCIFSCVGYGYLRFDTCLL